MLLHRLGDGTLYNALLAGDSGYDDFAYVGVATGIFYQFTCATRKSKCENMQCLRHHCRMHACRLSVLPALPADYWYP